jgi:hypothetical protein
MENENKNTKKKNEIIQYKHFCFPYLYVKWKLGEIIDFKKWEGVLWSQMGKTFCSFDVQL